MSGTDGPYLCSRSGSSGPPTIQTKTKGISFCGERTNFESSLYHPRFPSPTVGGGPRPKSISVPAVCRSVRSEKAVGRTPPGPGPR